MRSNFKTVYPFYALMFTIVFLCMITSIYAQNCPPDLSSKSVKFPPSLTSLTSSAKTQLHDVAEKLKQNAFCTFTVVAYCASSKKSQSNAQKRVEIIKLYLVDIEGISNDRITTSVEIGGGDPNIAKFIPQ